MRAHKTLLALALTGALAVTSTVVANGSAVEHPLFDSNWTLVSLGETVIGDDVTTTLAISKEGAIGGNGGCNGYGGSIAFSGEDGISIGEVFSTMMYCGDESMAQERGYFDALSASVTYEIDGDMLILSDVDGKAVATLKAS